VRDGQSRSLPRVDHVVALPALDDARRAIGVGAVTELVRSALAEARRMTREGARCATADEIADRVTTLARDRVVQRTRRVINATGVVLHTNLGRAPLAKAAVEGLSETAGGYVSLEVEMATGRRGGRGVFAERALAELSGAEAALVVNNNAAAVLLALTSLASGRAVIVSRGELVEIGGGFRVPDVLRRSGARLVEVGTTNKTRESDYARALDAERDAAVVLRVHPGNFRQVGFVERPSLGALAGLAQERGVALVEDIGGGLLVELGVPGLEREPTVRSSVEAGADLVCFSTDKALGGPQGGVIVGRADLVDRLRSDPLARALRLGRLPLVALEATLPHILRGELDAVPGIDRIRYTSPHPKDMREDVVRAHVELRAVCEHIHLPLQSGSSRILRAMRRTYDRERYLDRVALIREHVPDVALTTDIIVGFPGETEEDFEQTLEVVEQVGYDGAFTFIFSPRRGTEAASVTEALVAHEVKVERLERLVAVVQRRAHERAQRFVGRTMEVLVEGVSRTDAARMRGRTRHNKVVNFSGLAVPGELALVDISAATSQTLVGEERIAARLLVEA